MIDLMHYLIAFYNLSSRMEFSRSSVKGLPPGSLTFHFFLFYLPAGFMKSLTEI